MSICSGEQSPPQAEIIDAAKQLRESSRWHLTQRILLEGVKAITLHPDAWDESLLLFISARVVESPSRDLISISVTVFILFLTRFKLIIHDPRFVEKKVQLFYLFKVTPLIPTPRSILYKTPKTKNSMTKTKNSKTKNSMTS
jgi:hypothetical protein